MIIKLILRLMFKRMLKLDNTENDTAKHDVTSVCNR